MRGGMLTVHCSLVATEAVGKKTGDATNGGNADAGQVVNFPVGEAFFEVVDDLPAVNQRLQFRGRAQIFKKGTAFLGGIEAVDGLVKRRFVALLAAC